MAIALPLFSQSAKATGMPITFGCPSASGLCAGTISPQAGGNAKTNGVGVTVANTFGPDSGLKFHLNFNTLASTSVTLNEIGGDSSALSGHFISKSVGPGFVFLNVVFTALPSEFISWLGGSGPGPFAFDGSVFASFALSGGSVTGAFIPISPTPEPTTYLLMGTGMLLCALVLRRTKSTRQSTLAA
jgi:hypothetical protein